jgi:hypothetical protein
VLIFNKLSYNTNNIKLYFKENDINLFEINNKDVINDKVYTMYIEKSNKYTKVLKINDIWYEKITTLSGRTIMRKLNIKFNYKLYDEIVFDIVNINKFDALSLLKHKYNNGNGNKNVASAIINDSELNIICKTGKF